MLASIVLFALSIILNLLAGYIGFLSGTGKSDRKKVFNRIKRKFLPLGGLSLTWLILTVIYFSSSKAIQDREQEQSQTKLMTNIADALGKYHLKYDSSQQRIIQVLHDSLRTSTTVINNNPPEPDFNFCTSKALVVRKLTKDTIEIGIRVCNKGAPSYQVNTKIKVVIKYTVGIWSQVYASDLISSKLSTDQTVQKTLTVNYSPYSLDKLYFWGTGSLKSGKSKTYYLNTLMCYDFKTQMLGFPNENDGDLDTIKHILGI